MLRNSSLPESGLNFKIATAGDISSTSPRRTQRFREGLAVWLDESETSTTGLYLLTEVCRVWCRDAASAFFGIRPPALVGAAGLMLAFMRLSRR